MSISDTHRFPIAMKLSMGQSCITNFISLLHANEHENEQNTDICNKFSGISSGSCTMVLRNYAKILICSVYQFEIILFQHRFDAIVCISFVPFLFFCMAYHCVLNSSNENSTFCSSKLSSLISSSLKSFFVHLFVLIIDLFILQRSFRLV